MFLDAGISHRLDHPGPILCGAGDQPYLSAADYVGKSKVLSQQLNREVMPWISIQFRHFSHNDKGSHHQAPLGQYGRNEAIPEGIQGTVGTYSAAGHHLSGGDLRTTRRRWQSDLCGYPSCAAEYAGEEEWWFGSLGGLSFIAIDISSVRFWLERLDTSFIV